MTTNGALRVMFSVGDLGSTGPRLRSVPAAPGSDLDYGASPAPVNEFFGGATASSAAPSAGGAGGPGEYEYVTPFGSLAEKMAKSRAQLDQLTARRQELVDLNSTHHLDADE